ncbi:FAD-dependent oxidoreductase [Paracoccus sp. S-4012]|uniref:NAD(P)/FAD-dependent oxidoreductase n=1 Tax=Paracoccus sp. S-4012 TaxID=2665648 RepID=UPI0012AEE2A4|nr:FAD-binding oxidoreductase [Paracoccus sp. S-4012]MRX49091.1 FAD-dependent oxidoreductase [Paracoccus sp. S-4012]
MSSEVTVVGAGIFGLACAWAMARRGARVRVLEAARIGAGSSGGNVGALSPHAPENWNEKKQVQLESLLAAEGFWGEVAAAGGVDSGYGRIGRLQPVAADGVAKAEARIAAAKAHWPEGFGMRLVDAPEGLEGLWLHDRLSARIAPRRALAALAAAIRAAGGVIKEGCGEVGPEGPTPPVVWATGAPGLAVLGAGGGVKGQSALLALPGASGPQLYTDGLHVVPHADGTVAIGSTSERAFSDGTATDAQLDALIERARAAVPALRDAPVADRWAGVRPRAASRAPLVGAWPGRPGHVIANGGFKIGFGMAPWVAAAVADLVLGGDNRIPAAWRVS